MNTKPLTYPFGSVTPGRSFTSESYRYGFNGQEKDNETVGAGNSYDFGDRIYDARLGRWLSIDPLVQKYPHLSPFDYVDNNPILFVDINGNVIVINYLDAEENKKSLTYTPGMSAEHSNDFVKETIESLNSYHSSSSTTAKNIVEDTHKSPRIVEVNQAPFSQTSQESPESPDKGNVAIFYDPVEGSKFPNQTVYPPSMMMLIELEHAREEMKYLEKIDLVKSDLAKKGITDYENNPDYQKALNDYNTFRLNHSEEEERNFKVEKELAKELGYGKGPEEASYFDAGPGSKIITKKASSTEEIVDKKEKKTRVKHMKEVRENGQGN